MPNGLGGFFLDKQAADKSVYNGGTATNLRTGPGTLIDFVENHSVDTVGIINLSGRDRNW